MKKTVTLEEAFAITIELFKIEQRRRERAEECLEWITSHEATSSEYKIMAKRCLDSKVKPGAEGGNGRV